MMSMILLVLHAAQATSEAPARPEEEKPQSERPARPGAEKVEKEIEIVNRFGLGATQGSSLRIRIEGPGASEAMREIQRLTQSWCDEDRI
jgi:hypothetical protein